MQNQYDSIMIGRFLAAMSPVITEIIKKALRSYDASVEEQGSGLGTILIVKSDEKQADFHLHNLFLEIATIDRDEHPLRFDERLRDFDFFMSKTNRIIRSKLNILMKVFSTDDIEDAIEKIKTESKHYERINIWMLDPKKFN